MMILRRNPTVLQYWRRSPTYALVVVVVATAALTIIQLALKDTSAPSTLRNVILLTIQVAGVGAVFLLGRQRPSNVGLGRRNVGVGLIFTVVLIPVLVLIWWIGDQRYVPPEATSVAAQVWVTFGAFAEEVTHRAFIFPQIYLRLRERTSSTTALLGSVVVTQTYFGLLHAPRFWTESAAASALFASIYLLHGIIYVVVYIRTGSIIAATGCHLVANWGNWLGLRVQAEIIRLFGLVLAIMWPHITALVSSMKNRKATSEH